MFHVKPLHLDAYPELRLIQNSEKLRVKWNIGRMSSFPFEIRKNLWETSHKTFRTLKSDLDIRPVYHKTDGGIKAHLNLAVLAYRIVSVTKYRLKMRDYPYVRWDEIMRIAQPQVVVTAEKETVGGDRIRVRQSTEAEEEPSVIYSLLDINANPIGKVKSVVHPNPSPKNSSPENQGVT